MTELRKLLLDFLGERIAKFGFNAKPDGQSFLRPFQGGRCAFHISFINHQDNFDVTASVGVRFDDLEMLLHGESTLLTKKEITRTYSLSAELGNIAGTGQRRWGVTTGSSAAEIAETADQIVAAYQAIGAPYLEKASTMGRAIELLRLPDRAAWLHQPFDVSRAKSVVGLAYLLDRKNDIPALIQEQRLMLENLKSTDIEDFQRFVKTVLARRAQ